MVLAEFTIRVSVPGDLSDAEMEELLERLERERPSVQVAEVARRLRDATGLQVEQLGSGGLL